MCLYYLWKTQVWIFKQNKINNNKNGFIYIQHKNDVLLKEISLTGNIYYPSFGQIVEIEFDNRYRPQGILTILILVKLSKVNLITVLLVCHTSATRPSITKHTYIVKNINYVLPGSDLICMCVNKSNYRWWNS